MSSSEPAAALGPPASAFDADVDRPPFEASTGEGPTFSPGDRDAAGDARRERRLRLAGKLVFGLIVAGFLARVLFTALNRHVVSSLETGIALDALLMTFPVVGFVLVLKRPRNPLGWLLMGIGSAFASTPGAAYARYAAVTRDGELPGAGLALALESPSWVVFIGLSGFVLLLFPDGHLPSPRWRWFARACAIGLVGMYLAILVSPDQGVDYGLPQVENPIAIDAMEPFLEVGYFLALIAPITVVGGAVALIRRRRRTTDPVVRQQLRWLTWAAGVIAFLYASAFIPQIVFGSEGEAWGNVLGTIAVLSFLLIPITVGIAVMRYRLYDIDLVIKKTVVIAVLVALIAMVYVAIVVGVGALVGSRGDGREGPVLSAIAAGVVALLFQPLRMRARRLADRVVYGARATPYEVLGTFGDQLAGTYSADDVLPRIARVLAEGVAARRARVWLRVGGELRVVSQWPEDLPEEEGSDDLTVEVRHHGEELGALSVVMPANDPLDPTKEQLVHHLAGQAGLVLSNVRLTEELRARLDDLRAAQKRLVTAQDAERKRLERNIHDGAQQQLVALSVKLRLAEQLMTRDVEKAREALTALQVDTTQTLEDLRDLARGIYPPLLAEQGLGAALAGQARRATLPIAVDVDIPDRYPPEIEAAVYFSCLEALQNVAKYAQASHVEVHVRERDGAVAFEVTDDGRGFDPSAGTYGTGLQGIADRLGALDGMVEVHSAPGSGTTVRGRIPVPSTAAVGADG